MCFVDWADRYLIVRRNSGLFDFNCFEGKVSFKKIDGSLTGVVMVAPQTPDLPKLDEPKNYIKHVMSGPLCSIISFF